MREDERSQVFKIDNEEFLNSLNPSIRNISGVNDSVVTNINDSVAKDGDEEKKDF